MKNSRNVAASTDRSMWIELDGWQAKLRFSACHFIPDHPKCGRLHGHTYAISAKIVGAQIHDFVIDFEDIKKHVAEICEALDHKILLASRDADVKIRNTGAGDIAVTVGKCGKRYCFPREDVFMLPISSASAEDLCSFLLDELCNKLDLSTITEVSVRLDEGLGQGAGSVRYFPSQDKRLRA
ncbi:MAG: 6-carboxytetrahydropterin synthase [Halobacteriota archaeon]|jgi:6-pyruvoyltetrahydropterin/6-carboxytetrahydropterin synthase